MIGVGKFVIAVVAATGVTASVGYVAAQTSTDQAVVQRIVDGDTFEASIEGRTTSVRLLNIDTPETKDPNRDVECLGPEASARLAQMIPVGSTVELAYDAELLDRFDRTLAAVYDGQDQLVNAEIAREGLGVAAQVGGNDRFYGEVAEAQEEARAAGRGLYADDVACTLPARAEAVGAGATAAQDAATQPPSQPAELDQAAARAQELLGQVTGLQSALSGPRTGLVWRALSATDDRRLSARLSAARDAATSARDSYRSLAAQARERQRVEAQQAAQAERDRLAREAEAREARIRQAAVARQEAQRAREAERRQLATVAPLAPAAADPGSGCEPGYSPCLPVSAEDLDCGDLGGSYSVTGSDRHRLAADDDGIGCES